MKMNQLSNEVTTTVVKTTTIVLNPLGLKDEMGHSLTSGIAFLVVDRPVLRDPKGLRQTR